MSGGVDSSVSAVLLKEAGFDVAGVFIKVWQPDFINEELEERLHCNWREDRLDAMRVCALLNIQFMTIDLEKTYKKEVVDYMIDEYRKGRTPNPDVMCNKQVKFGAFYSEAVKRGADYVATGHYAQIKKEKNNFFLTLSNDHDKDQTYFLWNLKREQLPHILFPIGHLKKNEVRKLAKKYKLPVAQKKDSQGLCFLGKIDIKDFLKRYIKEKEGHVLNVEGNIIGHNNGAFYFTIGERHGFTVLKKTPQDKPLYVISKDIAANTITVSERNHSNLSGDRRDIIIEKINWINRPPKENNRYKARIRHRQALSSCTLSKINDNRYRVHFDLPQFAPASGQSCVIYDNDTCLGGGIIE